MRVLLDTHTLIWAVDDPAKLGPTATPTLQDPANELLVMPPRSGRSPSRSACRKLTLSGPYRAWMNQALSDLGATLLPISIDSCRRSALARPPPRPIRPPAGGPGTWSRRSPSSALTGRLIRMACRPESGRRASMAITTRNRLPLFSAQQLEALSRILGDTEKGLTGTEIDHLLRNSGFPNPTRYDEVEASLQRIRGCQNEHQVGNHVLVFIQRAMDPARYVGEPTVFRARKDRLNSVLALCGFTSATTAKSQDRRRHGPSTRPSSGPTASTPP